MTEADLQAVRDLNARTRQIVQQSLDRPMRAVLVPVVFATLWAAVVIAGTVAMMRVFG